MKITRRVTPLFYIEDKNQIIGLKGLTICYFDINLNKIRKVSKIKRDIKYRIVSKSNLLTRLFRFYPRAISNNGNLLFFALKDYLYLFNLKTNELKEVCRFRQGMSSPLSLCNYKDGVIYGEYFNNTEKEPVNIVFSSTNISENIVVSIDGIRHIHGIIPTDKDQQFLVFTGDDKDEAGIGLLTIDEENSKFKFILRGEQESRGCNGVYHNGKVYYATDSPFQMNYFYEFDLKTLQRKKLFSIEGSSIFGKKYGDRYVFSTCVESNLKKNADNSNTVINIDGAHGGILSKRSKLYSFNVLTQEHLVLDVARKDSFNIHYFGFGSFLFTSASANNVVYYSNTLKKRKKSIYIVE